MEFGISLDPLLVAQRHALYDSDEEEEEITGTSDVFSVRSPEAATPERQTRTLLIALGAAAVTFARSHLDLSDQPIFRLLSRTSRVVKGQHFPAHGRTELEGDGEEEEVVEVSLAHEAKGKPGGESEEAGRFVVCIHEKALKSEYCNLWAAKLLHHLKPTSTIVLDSAPFQEHFSPYPHDPDRGAFVRSLHSSVWPHPPTAAFLEPPNTVKGEAAAVLTHCQMFKLAASVMVIYLPPSQSSLEKATAFRPVLHLPLIADCLEVKGESEAIENAKRLFPRPRADLSHLYT